VNCRFCNSTNLQGFVDLGYAAPSNSYLGKRDLNKPETTYPLRVKYCKDCWLVQTEDYASAEEIFNQEYAYLSSTSSSWLKHAHDYVEKITDKLGLNNKSFVVEIAANDGYLLQNFVNKEIPCIGIEPTESTAELARKKGIKIEQVFFGTKTAEQISKKNKADLIIGNNVYAHVPDLNDFTSGLEVLLSDNGTVTLEFPHFLNLMKENQFDTIYHEHYSYFSLITVIEIFKAHKLEVYDVEELKTHGGSIRVYGCKANSKIKVNSKNIETIIKKEINFGLNTITPYDSFQEDVDVIKNNLLEFLLEAKSKKKLVVGYGAAAKGNTFLNYAGVKPDLLPYIFDNAPSKQNKFSPTSHIPILNPNMLDTMRPDYILILPWNLSTEISSQLEYVKDFGCRFVTAIPKIKIF